MSRNFTGLMNSPILFSSSHFTLLSFSSDRFCRQLLSRLKIDRWMDGLVKGLSLSLFRLTKSDHVQTFSLSFSDSENLPWAVYWELLGNGI